MPPEKTIDLELLIPQPSGNIASFTVLWPMPADDFEMIITTLELWRGALVEQEEKADGDNSTG